MNDEQRPTKEQLLKALGMEAGDVSENASEKTQALVDVLEDDATEDIGATMEMIEGVAHVYYDEKIRRAMTTDAAELLSDDARYKIRDVGIAGRLLYKRQVANWLVFWTKGLLGDDELEKRLEYLGRG